ncbi:XRE family transcriptional regulator [Amycolatopsis mediterranei S699]|uniref:XRE family transcriptional regulator n=2 Tax=Amycolatopsis mediterranei TaxID=33910 RepID=A0A9R0NZW2_AMYMS|nr:helix-turn-helix transcriptional regulator [Amycolatopsis mediterranei]AEK43688.1 XRE family transcriptional regulator [Amycolatopsis mediterranei S699]AFO78592.1 XRE family transcriptional regulator [Amycolatopsis mediterranei S699]AGT85720.1 XRE family transcriptional regulator [Amycolatopsis mediterranei RB]KDO04687.1 XRE family transcriptional regulator [Amycolatopsis mediterranei]KDU85754.1 XRE family transcriptional regulator [Amycolatopsis mediterranei]
MANTGLGTALRHWRDRVSPQAAGLPAGSRRRAAGLRREELAQLAGISADYVIRLEQGRATSPSAQVVEALARALRLTHDERTHLFRLAGLAPPGPGTVPRHITPGVHRMLDRLAGTPVAVFDAAWNQLLANPLYTALMGEWHGSDLNGVRRNFLSPDSRVRDTPGSRDALQAALVADLRRTAGRYPEDRDLRALITDLRRLSTRFAELWDSGAVGHHESARKTIDHPDVGTLTLDCDVLSVAGSDLRLMVYTAEPGSEEADRLALLDVLGTQSLGVEEHPRRS